MGIQAIGNGMSFDPQSMFKKLDTNGDGGIDKSEFLAAAKKKDGTADPNAEKMFAKIDTNGDSKIDGAENTAALKKMSENGSRPQRPQGPPPGGKPASASSSSSSSVAKTYDVQDTNQDGTVSAKEKIDYILKQIEDDKKAQSSAQNYDQRGQSSVSTSGLQNTFSITA